jgi:exopolysaccharide biosynthesis polyprenyl glycosylphosphotransferase
VNLELLFSRQTASPPPATAATVPLSERLLTRRILILGSGPMAAKVVEEIEAIEGSRDVVAGLVDHEEPQGPWARNTKWLGPPSRLAEIVERVRPHRIVVAVADRRDRLPLQLLLESRVRGVIVEDAVEFYERLTGKMAIEWLNPSSLILSKGFRIHGAAEIVARIVSVIGAAVGLVLAAPLLLAIALAIKLDSRGPVLFIQSRVGRNDRPFGLFKFRTMLPTEGVHSEWARDNTHRITRVGRWLRRFRLDEVPQLVNVLAGEMNLVGPRPHPTSNHEIFMDQIACYPLRSTVRPGVTGWAQIRYGYANDLEEETEKMRYDLFYIKNRSIWLDASILFRTVFIVILGQGATEVKRRTTRHTDMTWSSVRTGTDGAVSASCLVSSVTRRPSSGRR